MVGPVRVSAVMSVQVQVWVWVWRLTWMPLLLFVCVWVFELAGWVYRHR